MSKTDNNYSKAIWLTVLYTTLGFLGVLCIAFALMYFVFTSAFADFFYSLGADNFASNLYYKSYKKSGEIVECYKALNIKIKLGKSSDVVTYYNDFVSDEKYDEFMSHLKESNEEAHVGILEKSTLLNEENYLVCRYVRALIDIGNSDDAWSISVEKFSEYETFSLSNPGVYSLGEFVSNDYLEKFTEKYDGFEDTLLSEIQKYFDASVDIFETNADTTDPLNRAYLVSLGNRIINCGQDINAIYTALESNENLISNNTENMIKINDMIKVLL